MLNKQERTSRNRWRRNLQSIAYNFPDYDFLSDAYSEFFNYLREHNPNFLAKAYNSLCLYSEVSHIQRDVPSETFPKKSKVSKTTLRCLFDKFSLNKDSKNLSHLLSDILLYTKQSDPATLKESENFSRDLNSYLRTYFIKISDAIRKTRPRNKQKTQRKIG